MSEEFQFFNSAEASKKYASNVQQIGKAINNSSVVQEMQKAMNKEPAKSNQIVRNGIGFEVPMNTDPLPEKEIVLISELNKNKKKPGADTAVGLIKNYGFKPTELPDNLTHEKLLKRPDLLMKWQEVFFQWSDEEDKKDAFNDQFKRNKQLYNLIGELVSSGVNQTVAFFHPKADVDVKTKDDFLFQGNFIRVVTIKEGWVHYTRFERNEKQIMDLTGN